MGAMIGGFIGSMLIPFILLMISGRTRGKGWIRIAAVAISLISVWFSLRNGERAEDEMPTILAAVTTSIWAFVQEMKQIRKVATPPLPTRKEP